MPSKRKTPARASTAAVASAADDDSSAAAATTTAAAAAAAAAASSSSSASASVAWQGGVGPAGTVVSGKVSCYNPATGALLGTVECTPATQVKEIVSRARRAQQEWRRTTFAERRRVLQELLYEFTERKDEICRLTSEATGKALLESMMGEVLTVCEHFRWTITQGETYLRPDKRSTGMLAIKKAWVEYDPLGVIGVIQPWNYPFHHITNPLASCLMTGNAMVLKPSEFVLHASKVYITMIQDVLARCGHSRDLAQLVYGGPEVGKALCVSGVDKIIFVGSCKHGKSVMQQAAETLTPVVLELGGKDPYIVLDDANLNAAVDCATRGVFTNCGQNCIASERFYVHSKVYDEFVRRVLEVCAGVRQGDPLCGKHVDLGSMTTRMQLDIVRELVDDAVASGAKVLFRGTVPTEGGAENGIFYPITVLGNVTHNMRIVREELFGPVMLLMKFDDDDEVVRLASSSEYSLGLSIMSRNRTRALRIARQVPAGMTCINDFGIPYLIQSLPFGGVRASGFGRFNGPEGLRGLCSERAYASDFLVTESVPRPLRLPYAPVSYDMAGKAVELMFARRGRIAALFALVRLILLYMLGRTPK